MTRISYCVERIAQKACVCSNDILKNKGCEYIAHSFFSWLQAKLSIIFSYNGIHRLQTLVTPCDMQDSKYEMRYETKDIKHRAFELGFDLVGITNASPIDVEQITLLHNWLESGYAGQMDYLRKNFEKRVNPARLLKGAWSVIVVGLNYSPPKRKAKQAEPTVPTGSVANYAQYEDYHGFIKKRLRKLIDFIRSVTSTDNEFRICVDSAPLAERALAVRAGLGFIGKNHMLINPGLGPQIFLAEIVTTLRLQPDEPIKGNCTNCHKCIDACPTGALSRDGQFNANRCISYLTIEHKGQIDPEQALKINNRIFGCDECVLACPHLQKAPVRANKQLRFYAERAQLDLHRILNMTASAFNGEFFDSPIRRLGLDRLKRNARVCLANLKAENQVQ